MLTADSFDIDSAGSNLQDGAKVTMRACHGSVAGPYTVRFDANGSELTFQVEGKPLPLWSLELTFASPGGTSQVVEVMAY